MALSRRRTGVSKRPMVVGGGILLAILVAAGAWFWLRDGDGGETPGREAAVRDTTGSRAVPAEPAEDLPELDASDELVRRLAAELSSRPQLAEWLANDDLTRRFVGAVVRVANGRSPREPLEFMEPREDFQVRRPGGAAGVDAAGPDSVTVEPAVVDPASYRRYDPVAATFASLDTPGTADLYRRLGPLFREAYRELGFREPPFDQVVARAVGELLAVPVPEGPVQVVAAGATEWAYRDPALENLSAAQKHLLRMGPENVRRIQTKLRELVEVLDLPRLPAGASGLPR